MSHSGCNKAGISPSIITFGLSRGYPKDPTRTPHTIREFALALSPVSGGEREESPYHRGLHPRRPPFCPAVSSHQLQVPNPRGDHLIDAREYRGHLLLVKNYKPAAVNHKLASLSAFCTQNSRPPLGALPRQAVGRVSLMPPSLVHYHDFNEGCDVTTSLLLYLSYHEWR